MVQSSDEHSTARLGNKIWRLPVIWVYMKQFICIWIPTKRAGLWTHMDWDWNWTTCMKRNEKILTCLQAIEIHSDVTPSYAMMRSDRRGLETAMNTKKRYARMVLTVAMHAAKIFSKSLLPTNYAWRILSSDTDLMNMQLTQAFPPPITLEEFQACTTSLRAPPPSINGFRIVLLSFMVSQAIILLYALK